MGGVCDGVRVAIVKSGGVRGTRGLVDPGGGGPYINYQEWQFTLYI